ncbi:carbohydrate-binding protein [Photobacterium aquae]|uniref:carbohydrate-binding protein n=1 Tax=Photobacterium aquae TaxID=1195763 RepID=UPI00069E2D0B|nr:carbohydrate-binding protein [Photobacterium aquae]
MRSYIPLSTCQVAIEFGASNVGQATVTLAFEIDKTNTVYQSVVQAQVSDSGQTGNCANEWQAGQVYNKGNVVFWQGSLWQAQWWNQGADPTQSGPWGVWQQVNGNGCDNPDPTPDPTPEPPVPVLTPDPEPTPPVGGNAYVAGGSYQPGDIVTHNGASYQCRAWPNGLWCSSSPVHYEPGRGVVWQDAWTRL